MVKLELNADEAKVLRNILENYKTHLRIEIVGTYRREFRDALKERERVLEKLISRIEEGGLSGS